MEDFNAGLLTIRKLITFFPYFWFILFQLNKFAPLQEFSL